MGEQQKPSSMANPPPDPPPPSWRKYPNPPDPFNPDPATLREQWSYAIRRFSRLYSHAWGTAILAGVAFFGLGWFIKGSNPLPSRVLGNDADRPLPPRPADASTDQTNQ